ncbi:MAG: MBL fold metallo-hydrolase [Bryobacteraceae bacterium]|jgi:glyoxylase-like metal-dependent hydrolase (beta-lactamase superfamily II)
MNNVILLRTVGMSLLLATTLAPIWGQDQFSGEWSPLHHEDYNERIPGPDLGDFAGLPINDSARAFAESWDASRLTLQEHQCRVHVSPYIYHGPLHLRIWEEKDPNTQQVIAIKNYISTYEQTRTIWMDGRPHPPDYAVHTFMGFSTGKWEGDMLTVYTTHIKQGWARRNGLPESDQATMTEHFLRHGNIMTHVTILSDPVYLSEPLIRTDDFLLDEKELGGWLWPCEYVEEILTRPKGAVPNYLPGQNKFLYEYADKHHLPHAAVMGGASTMYPEYRKVLETAKIESAPAVQVAASPAPRGQRSPENTELHILPVQGNVYMLVGAGGNITVQVGSMGVLLVDTGLSQFSDKVIAAVRTLSDKPIHYIINTHVHPDHVGGNETLAKTGGGSAREVTLVNTPGETAAYSVQIIAHQNVFDRMSATASGQKPYPESAWPTDTYLGAEKEVYFNGEAVQMFHPPAAHTDGDTIAFFRRSDVVSTGDIFVTNGYPIIDLKNGGSLQGEIDGLNHILDIAIPAHHEEGGTYIIPGHGRLCDEFDVLEYRDMVTIVRDRIQAMIKKGMTLDQVKAARPTLDYDPRYNTPGGFWTADMFVEAAYKSLTQAK